MCVTNNESRLSREKSRDLTSRDWTTRHQIKQIATGWTSVEPKKSNVLNDKRIKSCLWRFDSGAYSRLQFLRAVSHSVGAHTVSPKPRVDNGSNSNSSEDEDENRHGASCAAAPTSGASESATAAAATTSDDCCEFASWRHVLASHWCRADIEDVDSIQDDAMLTKKTFRNWSISQSHNQSLFYSAPKRCPESWPT